MKKVSNSKGTRVVIVGYFVTSTVVLTAVVIYEIAVNDTPLSSTLTNVATGVFILILGTNRFFSILII